MTAVEAAGLAVAINELVERATGRKRPDQTASSTAFFVGVKSFTAAGRGNRVSVGSR